MQFGQDILDFASDLEKAEELTQSQDMLELASELDNAEALEQLRIASELNAETDEDQYQSEESDDLQVALDEMQVLVDGVVGVLGKVQ